MEEMLLTAEAERDRLTSTIAEFQEEAEVLQLLLDTLETAEGEAKTRYLAPVVRRVEPYLKMLLPGSNIVLDENLQIAALQRSGQREDFEVLSGGTKEQLAVLTRLASQNSCLDKEGQRPLSLMMFLLFPTTTASKVCSMYSCGPARMYRSSS